MLVYRRVLNKSITVSPGSRYGHFKHGGSFCMMMLALTPIGILAHQN